MLYINYILYSEKLGRFYKGQTSNLIQRVKRHNHGYENSTSGGAPWILVWRTSKATRREALLLERKLKNLSQLRLIAFMRKYEQGLTIEGEVLIKGFEP